MKLNMSELTTLKRLLSPEMYEKRFGTSYLDPFFKTNVSTKNLKRYSKLAKEERRKERMHKKAF